MTTKIKKTEIDEEEVAVDGRYSAEEKAIVEIITNPNSDSISGWTRLPQDLIRPMAYARTFVNSWIELCKTAKESQKKYSENYKKWHSEDTEISGVGKRILPDPYYQPEIKQSSLSKFFGKKIEKPKPKEPGLTGSFNPQGFVLEAVNVNRDKRFTIPEAKQSPVFQYIFRICLNRRSTTDTFTMGLLDIAGRKIDARVPETDDTKGWDKYIRKQ